MRKLFTLLILTALVIGLTSLGAACSADKEAGSGSAGATPAHAVASPTGATAAGASQSDDIPAAVKAAFPKAQITKQHKDLTDAQVARIEKQSGVKLEDKDHHSYRAFANEGGARKQIGAATVVKAGGRELVIVYASEKGSPVIEDVHGVSGGIPHAFLDQFKGKGHDSKLRLGQDIKAQGVDEAVARAATDAIRLDVVTMQALYGAAHSHGGAHSH